MTKKIATPADAEGVWNEMETPTSRSVQETLIARGFVTPSFKTIATWRKKGGWVAPRKPGSGSKGAGAIEAHGTAISAVARQITGKPEPSNTDVVEALTGPTPPPTEAGQVAHAHYQAMLDRLVACDSDEALLTNTAREAHRTATILYGAIAAIGSAATEPGQIALVSKAFADVSSGLEPAGVPLSTIADLRSAGMKTIGDGAEILPPAAEYDPLDEALAAAARDAA